MTDGARTGSVGDGDRIVPQPDSPKPIADAGQRGYIAPPVGQGGAGETAQRLGRGPAVQRDAQRAHAHAQAGGDRRSTISAAGRSASTSSVEVIHGRLHKLDPFRYELVDIPVQVPPSDVAGELRGRPDLPRAALSGRQSRRAARARRGGRPDRQHAAGPQPAAVGDVLHRGPGRRPNRGARQDPSRAGRRGRVGQPDGARHGSAGRAAGTTATRMPPIPPPRRASCCGRRSPTTCARSAGCRRRCAYTAQGIGRVRKSSKKLSPELTRPFTPPPSFMNHRSTRYAGSPPPRWRWPTSRRPPSISASRSTTWCWPSRRVRCANCCCATTATPTIRCWPRYR